MPDQQTQQAIDAAATDATLSRTDGRWCLTMTRQLPHAPERVWPWLVERDRLVRWSPIVPQSSDFAQVGPAQSCETPDADEVDAEVLVFDPPRELVHRWGEGVLRWTLHPDDAHGTRLQLEHTFDDREIASMSAGGWHVCFGALRALLDGADVERPIGERATAYGWAHLRDAYEAEWAR